MRRLFQFVREARGNSRRAGDEGDERLSVARRGVLAVVVGRERYAYLGQRSANDPGGRASARARTCPLGTAWRRKPKPRRTLKQKFSSAELFDRTAFIRILSPERVDFLQG